MVSGTVFLIDVVDVLVISLNQIQVSGNSCRTRTDGRDFGSEAATLALFLDREGPGGAATVWRTAELEKEPWEINVVRIVVVRPIPEI